MSIDYAAIFRHHHPDFFRQPHIRALPPEHIFDEQALSLADFDPEALDIPAPVGVAYGMYTGDFAALQAAVREVDENWLPYFHPGDRIFAATVDGRIASFCLLDEFGRYEELKIAGPGCVGTVPAYRRQGIGLRMIQLATAQLKAEGYDLSWIHYTHVGHWYARLGYRTVLRWNCHGPVSP